MILDFIHGLLSSHISTRLVRTSELTIYPSISGIKVPHDKTKSERTLLNGCSCLICIAVSTLTNAVHIRKVECRYRRIWNKVEQDKEKDLKKSLDHLEFILAENLPSMDSHFRNPVNKVVK